MSKLFNGILGFAVIAIGVVTAILAIGEAQQSGDSSVPAYDIGDGAIDALVGVTPVVLFVPIGIGAIGIAWYLVRQTPNTGGGMR